MVQVFALWSISGQRAPARLGAAGQRQDQEPQAQRHVSPHPRMRILPPLARVGGVREGEKQLGQRRVGKQPRA